MTIEELTTEEISRSLKLQEIDPHYGIVVRNLLWREYTATIVDFKKESRFDLRLQWSDHRITWSALTHREVVRRNCACIFDFINPVDNESVCYIYRCDLHKTIFEFLLPYFASSKDSPYKLEMMYYAVKSKQIEVVG